MTALERFGVVVSMHAAIVDGIPSNGVERLVTANGRAVSGHGEPGGVVRIPDEARRIDGDDVLLIRPAKASVGGVGTNLVAMRGIEVAFVVVGAVGTETSVLESGVAKDGVDLCNGMHSVPFSGGESDLTKLRLEDGVEVAAHPQ